MEIATNRNTRRGASGTPILVPVLLLFRILFLLLVAILVFSAAEDLRPEPALLPWLVRCISLRSVGQRAARHRARRRPWPRVGRRHASSVGRHRLLAIAPEQAGDPVEEPMPFVQRTHLRGLLPADEVIGVHHRSDLYFTRIGQNLDRVTPLVGQLAREPTHVHADDILRRREPDGLGALGSVPHEASP